MITNDRTQNLKNSVTICRNVFSFTQAT